MDPKSVERLQTFLSQFNITDLSDGNLSAGVNTLAAFICSTANLSRPGSGIATKNGREFEIGANLVVSGGLSSSLCQEIIGSQLASYQDSYSSHIKMYLMAAENDRKSIKPDDWSSFPEFKEFVSQRTFSNLQQEGRLPGVREEKLWEDILVKRPQLTRKELYYNSQVYLQATNPKEINQCLAHAHRGKPFLNIGVHSVDHFLRVQPVLTKVTEGSNLDSQLSSFRQGFVLIDDSFNSFYQVIKNSPQKFPRFVWLLDGNPEMGLPLPPSGLTPMENPVELRHLKRTLLTAFALRIDYKKTAPQLIPHELSSMHTRWLRFLQTQEASYPGITSIAKKLLATLYFGLQSISNSYQEEYRKTLYATGVFEFAQYLVLRSIAARKSLLWSEQIEQDRQLKARILARLQSKALENRELYRSLSIPAAKCEELLNHLENDGSVQRENNLWNLTQKDDNHSTIELAS